MFTINWYKNWVISGSGLLLLAIIVTLFLEYRTW